MIDPEKTIREYHQIPPASFSIKNYTLSEFNTQFTSIEHAFDILAFIRQELKQLQSMRNNLEIPL